MQGASGGDSGPPPRNTASETRPDPNPAHDRASKKPAGTADDDYDPEDHYPENIYAKGYYRPKGPVPDPDDDAAWGDRRHVWMRRAWIGAAVLTPIAIAAVAWLVFLTGGDQPAGATAPPTPTASAQPSPDPSPQDTVPTIDPQAQQWLDVLSSDTYDWEAILEAFLLYRDWLDQNPHPDLLDEALHPNCPCFADTHDRLDNWHANSVHWTGEQQLVIHRVEPYLEPGMPYDDLMVAARETGWAAMRAVIEWTGTRRLVDAAGRVYNQDPSDGPVELNVAIDRRSGRWRVVSILNLGPPLE